MNINILSELQKEDNALLQFLITFLQGNGHTVSINFKPIDQFYKPSYLTEIPKTQTHHGYMQVQTMLESGATPPISLPDGDDVMWYAQMIKNGFEITHEQIELMNSKAISHRLKNEWDEKAQKMQQESLASVPA
ncbi:MAG: hypothetical protein V4576_01780 [Patescibacteria group bacterium]